MQRNYSRLAKLEEKRQMRATAIFGGLTVAFILFAIIFGIPLIARFASFFADIKSSNTPVAKNDTTPPGPPNITNLPEYSNQNSLTLEGTAEAGSTVTLVVNDQDTEVVTNGDGKFTKDITLKKDKNTIWAKAKDKAGNESAESKKYSVTFDNTKPDLTISQPQDGTNFSGDSQRQLLIKGQTEPNINLTINNRIVILDSEGNFTFTTTLSQGENSFNFKARDKGGNETEKTIAVNFSS